MDNVNTKEQELMNDKLNGLELKEIWDMKNVCDYS